MGYAKKIIIIFIVLLFTLSLLWSNVYASEQRVYDLVLDYNRGTVSKKSLTVTVGIFTDILDQPENGYRLEIKSFDNKILYSQKFLFESIGQQISIANQNPFMVEEDERELVFSYFPNGKEINIYDSENKKILTISVAHFAEVTPSPSLAPTINPTLEKDNRGGNMFLYIGLGGLVSGIAFSIYLLRNKSPRQ